MRLMARIGLLTLLSALGIALLAPLAARSAADAPPVVERADRLLPVAAVPVAGTADLDRGGLSSRLSEPARGTDAPERLDPDPLPTPGNAPMEATLYSIATPPPAAPAPSAPRPAAAPTYSGDSVWDDLAQCESGGNWSINTGNGYYGGLQFNYGTWHDYGGGEFAEYPHQATREQQIAVAERLRDARGYQPWPACRVKLGLP